MQANRWEAGSALMRAASAQGWQDLVAASTLARENQGEIAACQQAANNNRKNERCTIVVKSQNR